MCMLVIHYACVVQTTGRSCVYCRGDYIWRSSHCASGKCHINWDTGHSWGHSCDKFLNVSKLLRCCDLECCQSRLCLLSIHVKTWIWIILPGLPFYSWVNEPEIAWRESQGLSGLYKGQWRTLDFSGSSSFQPSWSVLIGLAMHSGPVYSWVFWMLCTALLRVVSYVLPTYPSTLFVRSWWHLVAAMYDGFGVWYVQGRRDMVTTALWLISVVLVWRVAWLMSMFGRLRPWTICCHCAVSWMTWKNYNGHNDQREEALQRLCNLFMSNSFL